jgi:hypothetical protein
MADISIGTEHGTIDLNPVIQPINECLRTDPGNLLRERGGKIFAVTDIIIQRFLDDKPLLEKLFQERGLFSNTAYAKAIATLEKDGKAREKQMKQIAEMEDLIYNHFRSLLNGREAEFFGQPAAEYFSALTALGVEASSNKHPASRNKHPASSIQHPQAKSPKTPFLDAAGIHRSIFPDARLLRSYPGTPARLRVHRHTIQLSDAIEASVVNAVKLAMRRRLSEELPEDETDMIIANTEKMLQENTSYLNRFLEELDRNAYGRIRRTYACSLLVHISEQLPENSPARTYARRVSDFNELVQGTLPESGLTADDLVLEFPSPLGKGTFYFDLMTEYARADALKPLPFWITFDELLSEVTEADNVTTTMGQHFKLNGKVPAKGFNSVFEYHVNKLDAFAQEIEAALASGKMPPNEYQAKKVLQVAVMYYVVYQEKDGEYRDALANYKELSYGVKTRTAQNKSLPEILRGIAKHLLEIGKSVNQTIRKDFTTLLTSRKPDNLPLHKEKLWFVISTEILTKTRDMENSMPVGPPPVENYPVSYLRYLKISRHPGEDFRTLVKEEIRLTESLRYLTVPQQLSTRSQVELGNEWKRSMKRDINRQVMGVLFIPYELLRLSLPFDGLTKLIIAYSRNQLHGITPGSNTPDARLCGLAQLIHVLLVYGVLKAAVRTENSPEQHGNRTMLMLLSLFSTTKLLKNSDSENEAKPFTHHAHKAVEHIIRQHMPLKSQGFRLRKSERWEKNAVSPDQPEDLRKAAEKHIQEELKEFWRFRNAVSGLSSGTDALWELPWEPSIRKAAIISVTSRACDKLNTRTEDDRIVMFGHIHRFEYEAKETEGKPAAHYYRHRPVQTFCDDMERAVCFKNPSVLFQTVRSLYSEGFRDLLIVTKVPFVRRIRMTAYDDSTYANPAMLQSLHKEMPDMRIYPLFTQKSYGLRLPPVKADYPMFLPPDPENDKNLVSAGLDNSTLFRAASVLTCKIVGKESEERLHSGITDYLFRCYPDTVTIQSEAVSALMNPGRDQACLHEILRFLHSQAYEKFPSRSLGKRTEANPNGEKPLEAKLDALESTFGEDSAGQQAEALEFPKTGTKGQFTVNIIALLKHLENQSLEVGNWKLVVGCLMLGAGSWILGAGC